MSVLRIYCPLPAVPTTCEWVLFDDRDGSQPGKGTLAQLPQGAAHVQLVLAAGQVLITRARLPAAGRRRSAALLAYAAEEKLASDPDANQVSRLGQVDGDDVLAAVDRLRLQGWHDALNAVGIRVDGVYCETLMLPIRHGEWSLAWNGRDGYVRTGEFEGGATDCGDRQTPPLALQLLLEDARTRDALPTSIALHPADAAAQPDLGAWQLSLGVDVRLAPPYDWRTAPTLVGPRIDDGGRRRWYPPPAALARWRAIGRVLLVALALHSVALLVDRVRLGSEQRQLRAQLEARFRALFPAAVAVADPVLQTRRQLAQARHAANQPDAGDFPVMLGKVAGALSGVQGVKLHALSYEDGRMTLELAGPDPLARQIETRLGQAGFDVEAPPAARHSGRGTFTLTPRSP
ncbi:type II secretion system protein GspL [Rhodanobacter sp. KK11]|uniref:type II secretion system protein GspL n=1 Tax=Rhodanobacter sp. KK11 TaxID=3083255 RepID=UPI002965FB16|nr:type II secretion system protein GspL [Rhodanobacter sp. KK11]MDW2982495.1 type II secretion system protein GspL [Rhodanobacter sp. KK11]